MAAPEGPELATLGKAASSISCPFEDSNGDCFKGPNRGVCISPQRGYAALVQHANMTALCERNPPYGFRPLCRSASAVEDLAMLRQLRDPARCFYRSCAVVGASGNLLGARLGQQIDAHDAVIRINLAPDARQTLLRKSAPHRRACQRRMWSIRGVRVQRLAMARSHVQLSKQQKRSVLS